MICQLPSRSGWLLLLGAVGLLGCVTGPAPGEEEPAAQTSEALSVSAGALRWAERSAMLEGGVLPDPGRQLRGPQALRDLPRAPADLSQCVHPRLRL